VTTFELIASAIALTGLFAGAFLIAQRPAFWVEMAMTVAGALKPYILKMLAASPETNERTKNDSRQAVERTITGREKER